MTDEQPTPPPLDLDAIQRRYDAVVIEPSWAAYARTDVPALVAEVRRLRAEVERLSVLASVTTSEALAGVTLPPDAAARLLAEQERDEARADLAAARAALHQIAHGVWTREWSPSSQGKSDVARAALGDRR